ncbi:MAG: hypothetical protein IMZ66_12335, partial [Planctomycetes bacterium]|nr:hypothetical protein [Planctomycetota bacterium]
IPAGMTLTLAPGALVLIDGIASGETAPDIDVYGAIQSLGTADSPVTFTAYTPGMNWGELHFQNAAASRFQYTVVMQAGNSPHVGHSNSGPMFRVAGSTIVFDHASLTDNAIGKIMDASGSDLTFTRSLFARSIMGPEIQGTSLHFEDSWITDMRATNDADGIYVWNQQPGQECLMVGGVIVGTDDDGIDQFGADLTVRDYIIRNTKDKGVSIYNGHVILDHCLIVETNLAPEDPTVAAVAAKTDDNGTATVDIDHTTIVATRIAGVTDYGIQSNNKYDVQAGRVYWNVTNSIIDATDPVNAQWPYVESDFSINYTDLFDKTWPTGTGNLHTDPLFVDRAGHDYRLQPGSPALDAGDPAFALDPDGSRTDMGYYSGADVSGVVVVTASATDPSAAEPGTDTGTFTLTRTGDTTDPLTVYYTVGGTAQAGSDYENTLSGQAVIPALAASVTITVTPLDDPDYELDETVVLTLTSNPAYAIGRPTNATVTIHDNDITTGVLTENTVWTAAEGPYRIGGELTVPAGISLTIMEGTSVYLDPGARLVIEGLLQADGSEYAPVRFTRTPGTTGYWYGLQFSGSMAENRLTHAILEYARTDDGMIGLDNSNLVVEDCTFDHTDYRRIRTIDSALVVRNSVFTDLFAPGEAPTWDNHNEHIWGRAAAGLPFIIEGNVFGTTKGHSDVIDVDGPAGSFATIQILGNTFLGGGDDALDLEGDAHIEGNVFMHFRKDAYNLDAGQSNAISAGAGMDYTVARNVFYDCDHAALVKQNAFMTFVNNTVYGAAVSGLYFEVPGDSGGPGRGAYVDGSIFWNGALDLDVVEPTTDLTVNRSIVAAAWHGYGTGNLDEDPRIADAAGGDFSLRPGSPALGTGPNGLDMGAEVASGAVIGTQLLRTTYRTDAVFDVGGAGLVAYKYSLDGAVWSGERTMDTPVSLAALGNGPHTLRVIGRSSAGAWQDEADAASWSWTVDAAMKRVLINEILAVNNAAVVNGGLYPDVVELYYDAPAGSPAFNLAGLGITNEQDTPNKFVFAAGTTIAAGGYLVLYADSATAAPGIHLGFNIDGQGDNLYLTQYNGGSGLWEELDGVDFGMQLPDLSIGRMGPDGDWVLTQPTLGAANAAARTGDASGLTINEWFANGTVVFQDDWIELYNPDALPIQATGLYLTDNPVSQKNKDRFGPLSFIAGDGFAVIQADDSGASGHVGFRLSAGTSQIALFDADLNLLDEVTYIPQTTDVSQGRSPDADPVFAFFRLPTPGVGNPGIRTTVEETQTDVFDFNNVWRYNQTANLDGVPWSAQVYAAESTWPTGAGLLHNEVNVTGGLAGQELTIGRMTYYFRTHFTFSGEVTANTRLRISTYVDDGCVIYLNGTPIEYLHMNPGTITYSTAATSHEFSLETFDVLMSDFPAGTLKSGDNVLAVEVHQNASNSTDIVWGCSLAITETITTVEVTNPVPQDVQDAFDHLRVSEIMYDPMGGSDYEFIEFANTGASALSLAGVRLSGG